jgi:hypothetical protein
MIHVALHRPVPVELTTEPHVAARVTRLAAVSLVALGVITLLAAAGTAVPWPALLALIAGWVLMPVILLASLGRPDLRYWLLLPSTLVTLGLLAIAVGWLPTEAVAAAGWLLVLAGALVGGGLGAWFWYRLLPVPRGLDSPAAPGRWAFIALHVSLVVAGLVLVVAGMLRGAGAG